MKKRQRKKNEKKYLPVIADEFALLTMTAEERTKAYEALDRFRRQFAFRKRYCDLKGARPLVYYFSYGSLGAEQQRFLREWGNRGRKSEGSFTVSQSVKDLQ